MTTERHQPSREQASQRQSLREYWLKPTRFPADQSLEPTRRTAFTVTTPSLWEQTALLTTYSTSPIASGQESKQTVEAEPLLEEPPVPSSGNEPLRLRQRLQRRGVEALSTPELLSLL